MPKKSKAKRSPHHTAGPKKKRKPTAYEKPALEHSGKSLPERRKAAARRHAASMKTLVAPAPAHHRTPFVVGESSRHVTHQPKKKAKKKHVVTLRFTENTLKDIAALECVRRCFR